MRLGIGSRASDTELRVQDMTFAEFCSKLQYPKVGPKDGLYVIRGGLLKEPTRSDANLVEAELIVIDGDSRFSASTGEIESGAPDFDIAAQAFRQLGVPFVIHSTHSNRPDRPKWRAYIPAHMTDPAQLEPCVTAVIEALNGLGCYVVQTRECSAWSQAWFTPRVPSEEALEWFRFDANPNGESFNVEAAITAHLKRVKLEERVRDRQERPQPTHTEQGDSPIETFNKAASLDLIKALLEEAGYKFAFKRRDSLRFIAPMSETRMPGVTVFKGAKRGDPVIYSHHGAHDPLSGRLTDAFGLLWHVTHRGDQDAALEEAKRAIGWKARRDNLEGFSVEEITPEDFTAARQEAEAKRHVGPLFTRAKDFAAAWKPAEYLVDGIIQRGYCYSLTAPTGSGKTAVILNLTACIGSGRSFAGMETLPGRVGYFAAENPNDIQARWRGLEEAMNLDDPEVWFCPTTIDLTTSFEQVKAEIEEQGGFDLVIVDTSQAFFTGKDENSNAEMVTHAKNMRKLTTLPGNPCVVILCHPTKNASRDNLLPRGGGGFLAEVDGNLTLWSDSGSLQMHHQGKFRGAGFPPVNFLLKPVTPASLKDAKGRQIPTVVAEYQSDQQYEDNLEAEATDQDKVMILIMNSKGRMSISDIARTCGWAAANGTPHKGKVHRLISKLKEAKLVETKRNGKLRVTPAGEKEINPNAKVKGVDAAGQNEVEGNEF